MSNYKLAYNYDSHGFYSGLSRAWESPLEPGVYHIPGDSTLTAPPSVADGAIAMWTGSAWTSVEDNRGKTAYNVKDASQQATVPETNVVPLGLTVITPSCSKELLSSCSFDSSSGTWTVDPVKGSAAKYKKLYSDIDVRTAAILKTGMSYENQMFACDSQGQADVTALYLESQDTSTSYPISFYSGTAVWSAASASDLIAFCRSVKAFIGEVKMKALSLRKEIEQQSGESYADWFARLQTWTDPR